MLHATLLVVGIGASLGADVAFGESDTFEGVGDVSSPIAAYYNFVYAVSTGQAEAAIAQFTDDATVVAGAKCTIDTPCVGKVDIRKRYVDELIARKANAPISDQRFDGKRLTTRGEVTHPRSCWRGPARVVGGHVFEFSGGHIVSLSYAYDDTDAQTARFIACKGYGVKRVDPLP